jgi:hypothetical protein
VSATSQNPFRAPLLNDIPNKNGRSQYPLVQVDHTDRAGPVKHFFSIFSKKMRCTGEPMNEA